VVVHDRRRVRVAALQKLRGGIEAFGILQLGSFEAELREEFRRRKAVFDERVVQ
jgi:hypothetical protein